MEGKYRNSPNIMADANGRDNARLIVDTLENTGWRQNDRFAPRQAKGQAKGLLHKGFQLYSRPVCRAA